MLRRLRDQRREKVRTQPFPPQWTSLLEAIPIYRRLADGDRKELRGHIQIFLSEKRFEGCGGLEINDHIRVIIAAHAVILLLHRRPTITLNWRASLYTRRPTRRRASATSVIIWSKKVRRSAKASPGIAARWCCRGRMSSAARPPSGTAKTSFSTNSPTSSMTSRARPTARRYWRTTGSGAVGSTYSRRI